MPRPRSAEVRLTPTARGTVFSLRFSYGGQRHTVRLGGDWEGWDEARVERERGFLMQKVERGEWMPPAVDPGPFRPHRRAFSSSPPSGCTSRPLRQATRSIAPRRSATSNGACRC